MSTLPMATRASLSIRIPFAARAPTLKEDRRPFQPVSLDARHATVFIFRRSGAAHFTFAWNSRPDHLTNGGPWAAQLGASLETTGMCRLLKGSKGRRDRIR